MVIEYESTLQMMLLNAICNCFWRKEIQYINTSEIKYR